MQILFNPLVLFSLTIFTSATLLFFIEPMVGKLILPKFGGTPAVWNTCMLWFQAVLLHLRDHRHCRHSAAVDHSPGSVPADFLFF